MESNHDATQKLYKIFLSVTTFEGIIALFLLFRIPSMGRNTWLFGYSISRIVLGVAMLISVIILTWVTYRAFKDPDWLARVNKLLDEQLIAKERLLLVTIILLFVFLLSAGFLFLFLTPLSLRMEAVLSLFTSSPWRYVELLRSVFTRSQSVIIWMVAFAIQVLVVLGIDYSEEYRHKWLDGSVYRAFLAIAIILATSFHWAILYFRLKTFLVIPGWKWYFYEKEVGSRHLIFLAILVLAIILLGYILRKPLNYKFGLIMLIALGYIIQVGFGFIEGQGFASIRMKFARSVFNRYAEAASEEPDFINSLIDYEELYGSDWYLGTKPPGVLLFYNVTQKLSNLVNPRATNEGRFIRLTTFAAYLFPVTSFLVLIALFHFSKLLTNKKAAILPGILYIVCPSVILIPLFLDQVLYPLLFMLVLYLLLLTMMQQSVKWAFIVGGSIYVAIYFAFSLLPLLPLSILWIGIDYLLNRQNKSLGKAIKLILGLLSGVLVMFLLFRVFLNYDIILRYVNAMAQHRRAKEFEPGLQQIVNAIRLNNAEFAAFTGFPVIILFLSSFIKSSFSFVKRKANRLDGLLAAFLITYAILNLFGQTSGEVQRLWLFMLPLVTLFAAQELKTLFKRRETGIYLVITLQLITALLIFRFQDFYG